MLSNCSIVNGHMMEQHAKASAARAKIFEATIALLLEGGIQGTQTRTVTERAGVGTGLLNHYFRWPELRAAAWSSIFEAVARDTRRDGETPEQALDRFFAETFLESAHPIWRLWIEAENLSSSDSYLASALAGARTALRVAMTDLLVAGRLSGAWSVATPSETAIRLEAMRDGLAGMILSSDPEVDAAAAERQLRMLFKLECKGDESGNAKG
jgi:AcrR family transcriptional regulator